MLRVKRDNEKVKVSTKVDISKLGWQRQLPINLS